MTEGKEVAERAPLPEAPLREFVSEFGWGARFEVDPKGNYRIEQEIIEGYKRGILGLGYDGKDIWMCLSKNYMTHEPNQGWNANSRLDLVNSLAELMINVSPVEEGKTRVRFAPEHPVAKWVRQTAQEGAELGVTLHFAGKKDWSDHVETTLTLDDEGGLSGEVAATGFGEAKLTIAGLNVQSWKDGGWKVGKTQSLTIKP